MRRIVSPDDIYVNFECVSCGGTDWASVQWILDNGTIICSCGDEMIATSVEVEE